ncbi:hypothetical protein [Dyella sp.]|uniref:hypothetical protein n=1 Tax=Dyella sp. TaxID=1869338 RepID=UPI002ED66B3D
MRGLDFSSWQALLSTLLGLAIFTLVAVGIRLIVMQTVQQRRERENRQINERLRALMAAYKTLGGSFTGDLAVSPLHLRELRRQAAVATDAIVAGEPSRADSDRPRRIRDAVEAALSDIILLGTDEQVRLAALAAAELVAGRPVHVAELVVSLRNFIRHALDLEAIPATLAIPNQGPARPSSGASRGGKGEGKEGGNARGGRSTGDGMGGTGGMGHNATVDDEHDHHH